MKKGVVFIVDDEEDVVQLVAKYLGAWGYETACYYEGTGVVEEIQKKRPDLVLLDLRLPDISGMDVYRKLREDGDCNDIPIVFFSAHSEEEGYCLNELNAQGFVRKPYDPNELKELISRLIPSAS